MEKRIKVSVIIPTYDRTEIIGRCLLSLERQSFKQFEVVVVDDGTKKKEELMGILRQSKLRLRTYWQGKAGPAKARNKAVEKAQGEILVFLNDDSIADENLIRNHYKFLSSKKTNTSALVGLTINHPETVNGLAMKWLVGQSGLHFNYRFKNTKKITKIPWYYLWTCNCSIKKSFLLENKLKFDESFPTAAWEDIEFAYRAKTKGLKLYFDSESRVWHYHQMNFEEIKARFKSHGRGLWHLQGKLPNNFLPFLIKSRWGKGCLLVGGSWVGRFVVSRMENFVRWSGTYSNLLMQILVVGWKAAGYIHESSKKKMFGL